MNKPRDVMFYQMTLLEILQVLVDGKMPNGLIINKNTRLDSLTRVIPMVRDAYNVDPNIRLILKANQDEWIRNVDEAMELCDNAQKILDKDAISNSVNVRQDEYYKPNYRDIDCGYVGKRGIGYMG